MIKNFKSILLIITTVVLLTSVIGYAGDNKGVKQDNPKTSQVQTPKQCPDKHIKGECTKSDSVKCNHETHSAECKEKCSKECSKKCSKEDMEKCSKECNTKCSEHNNPKK